MIINPVLDDGQQLPKLNNPGTAPDLLAGKQLIDQYGNPLTGTMPQKSASDLTASGASVTVPAGYYPEQVSRSVATAAQAVPAITVSSEGLITAKTKQTAGYVSAGTESATKQLTTQEAQTITPGTSSKTISSGRYLTGTQTIKGDTNLKAGNIKSGVSIFGVEGNLQPQETVKLTVNITSSTGGVNVSLMSYSINSDTNFWTITSGKTETLKKGELIVIQYNNEYNVKFTFSNNILVGDPIEGTTGARGTRFYYPLVINGDATITIKIS